MRTLTNRIKYANKRDTFHTVDDSVGKAKLNDKRKLESEMVEVCLNCKKKKCTGTRLCYEKELEKRNDQD